MQRYINSVSPADLHRVLILLDLVNMFNEVSRKAVLDLLYSEPQFNCLIPPFLAFYGQPNKCHFINSDGQFDAFSQVEGFAQGCPLAGMFASLGLHVLLKQINGELAVRAAERKAQHPGDDGAGSLSAALAYLDDTFNYAPIIDVFYFLLRFIQLGPLRGLILGCPKTKILTSTTGVSPMASLPPDLQACLLQAFTLLCPEDPFSAELTSGIRLLGQPLGSPTFIRGFLTQAADTYTNNLQELQTQLSDKHTISAIFKSCAQPSISHLLAVDFALHASSVPPDHPLSLHNHDSPFTYTGYQPSQCQALGLPR
jgi:hypothetical protein